MEEKIEEILRIARIRDTSELARVLYRYYLMRREEARTEKDADWEEWYQERLDGLVGYVSL